MAPVAIRKALSISCLALVVSVAAQAAPLIPDHGFERVGFGVEDPIAILPLQGVGRAIIAQRNGDFRLVNGTGLINEPFMTLPNVLQDGCGNQGLLGISFHPALDPLSLMVVSYINTNGHMAVATVQMSDADPSTAIINEIYEHPIDASSVCDRLGGGVAVSAASQVYLGVGDYGNSADAGSASALTGKILRITLTGGPDGAFPGSPILSRGVRNPAHMTVDPAGGLTIHFADVYPAGTEINLMADLAVYGWDSSEMMGEGVGANPALEMLTGAGRVAMQNYNGSNLDSFGGQLLVGSSEGRVLAYNPTGDALTDIYSPEPDGPAAMVASAQLPDGLFYLVDENGILWRLVNKAGSMGIPSDRDSIVPLLVWKDTDGTVMVDVEREPGVEDYGIYTGDLITLTNGVGWDHGAEGDAYSPVDSDADDAWTTMELPGLAPNLSYILVSARNGRAETGLGATIDPGTGLGTDRPGGDLLFTCEPAVCSTMSSGDSTPGSTCVWPDAYFAEASLGEDLVPGGVNVAEVTDCKVTILLSGAEWCGPCRSEAPHVQGIIDAETPERVAAVSSMIQNTSGGAPDGALCVRWARTYGLSYYVVADAPVFFISNWVEPSGCTGGAIPQSFVLDADGAVVSSICGYNPASLDAAVRDALDG
ncbi:MAG: PQQ-dependent sugar dehydrogenase [Acidobacteriota bacterium]